MREGGRKGDKERGKEGRRKKGKKGGKMERPRKGVKNKNEELRFSVI